MIPQNLIGATLVPVARIVRAAVCRGNGTFESLDLQLVLRNFPTTKEVK